MHAIKTSGLTKIFGKAGSSGSIKAVDNVTLSVEEGGIFGLLGPNGAGKTTFIKLLLGISKPTAGRAWILGRDCGRWRAREQVGYLPEEFRFPSYFTGEQVLTHFGGLSGLSRRQLTEEIERVLTLVAIQKERKMRVQKYSHGMKQRLGIALAMLCRPRLLLLDEPISGVDPILRKGIREMLRAARDAGATILVSTHQLAEAELFCERILIMNRGRILKETRLEDLTRGGDVYILRLDAASEQLESELVSRYGAERTELEHRFRLACDSPDKIDHVTDFIRARGAHIRELTQQKLTLEEAFLNILDERTRKEE